MTPGPGIEPGTLWWEASALTNPAPQGTSGFKPFTMILTSIDFYDLFLHFSLVLVLIDKIINHTRQCSTTFSNTSKFVENVVKHSLSCLISYIKVMHFSKVYSNSDCVAYCSQVCRSLSWNNLLRY